MHSEIETLERVKILRDLAKVSTTFSSHQPSAGRPRSTGGLPRRHPRCRQRRLLRSQAHSPDIAAPPETSTAAHPLRRQDDRSMKRALKDQPAVAKNSRHTTKRRHHTQSVIRPIGDALAGIIAATTRPHRGDRGMPDFTNQKDLDNTSPISNLTMREAAKKFVFEKAPNTRHYQRTPHQRVPIS